MSRADTVHQSSVKHARALRAARTNNLTYHGGVGVETGADKVYIVQWGWTSDPTGEGLQQSNFFKGVGGSTWNNSVTQYCQGVASGTTICGTSGTHATNPAGVYTDANLWADNSTRCRLRSPRARWRLRRCGLQPTSATPPRRQTTPRSTSSTPPPVTQPPASGPSSTGSSYGNVAYTNFPYITDAGASCGQNFVNTGSPGTLDGVTIVGGHEFAETESDIFPNGGWLDCNGAENGDKCAWISRGHGASANVTFPNGSTYPVQSLWSNAFNKNAGGCVLSYP